MSHTIDLHPIQGDVLRVLLFQPQARYTDLNPKHVSTDQFTFHLKRLVELGYVEKLADGEYVLTPVGKEYANRFDTETPKFELERQAKLGVSVACVRHSANGDLEFLVQQRLKQPYYGWYGFVTGKVKWGEFVLDAGARELEEETGLRADLKLYHIRHKCDYASDGTLLEDKVFFSIRADNPAGQLRETFEGGKNIWLPKKSVLQLPNLFPGMVEGLDHLEHPSNPLKFEEAKYTVEGY